MRKKDQLFFGIDKQRGQALKDNLGQKAERGLQNPHFYLASYSHFPSF